MTKAVVFAYHNVGCACLEVLIRHGVEIALLFTHRDNPAENIWFDSVERLARTHDIDVVTPDDPNTPEWIDRLQTIHPDFIFSFYYRHMLKPDVLAAARRGAFNMHGSLLPKYRGRVPINWAIIKGETQTGATLHEMVEKPDAGRLVDQEAVPILPDDNAKQVFDKVTAAAARTLNRALPKLIDGSAQLKPQDLAAGSYFGGRKPADGIINWNDSAQNIHNLIRAVAPPYPGATTTVAGHRMTITRSELSPPHFTHQNPGVLNVSSARAIALCGDGRMLRVLEAEIDGKIRDEAGLAALLGVGVYPLGIY
jgi:methionyl-tRNA formyltransferase